MHKGMFISLIVVASVAKGDVIAFSSGHAMSGKKIVIAAVGDILMHKALQIKAAKQGFQSLWYQVVPYLQDTDITYGNLEGPIANGVSKTGRLTIDPGHRWDNDVYSSYPRFNAHPNLAKALRASGFDVVSFANNHSLDRYGVGIDRTIENLDRAGLHYTGVRKSNLERPWYTVIKSKGFSIAWIACTQDTNGIHDKQNQVLFCYKKQDQQQLFSAIKYLKNRVDAIIVSPHWGVQYRQAPTQRQQTFAKKLLNAGALAVIGSHPHCLQPMRQYVTKDGRQTFIAYSLGNFVSFQGTPKNRATVILYLTLKKTVHGTVIDRVRYLPLYMQNRSGEKKLTLTILTSNNQRSIGYRIIQQLLPSKNMIHV